ncbi:hypothetical protein ACLB2K_063474 [Fragaria x ananassa]
MSSATPLNGNVFLRVLAGLSGSGDVVLSLIPNSDLLSIQGDILVAKLWALCNGLKMAAGQNVTYILVESDSVVVVNLVKGEYDDTHPLHGLLTVCKTLWLRNWNCSIVHI